MILREERVIVRTEPLGRRNGGGGGLLLRSAFALCFQRSVYPFRRISVSRSARTSRRISSCARSSERRL